MTTFEALNREQKVRASIQRDVQSICTEACHFLGLDITKPAMELVLDIFLYKMTYYADDLERFAKHAKRTMITSDDCRLLTRRNNSLGMDLLAEHFFFRLEIVLNRYYKILRVLRLLQHFPSILPVSSTWERNYKNNHTEVPHLSYKTKNVLPSSDHESDESSDDDLPISSSR